MPTTRATHATPQTPTALPPGQRVAVVGAGIAGLASAWLLARRHRVTLFEAAAYPGGHAHTVDVELEGQRHPVDTGFLVFNDRTYPNLVALFDELGVATHRSDMSFSVSVDQGALEWAGTSLNTVFAQRRNLVSPSFIGMLRDILRFNAAAAHNYETARRERLSVGELLLAGGYGAPFQRHYLLPMAAAIWSSAAADVLRFPAATFLRFCINHALLQVNRRPPWKTVAGGSREYVARLVGALDDVRLATPVRAIRRNGDGASVTLVTDSAGPERFDAVVLASHAPTSLALLADADAQEAATLGAIRYQRNVALLHTDAALLPRRRRVWSAWNYLSRGSLAHDGGQPVCVSYLINQLQPLPFRTPVVVTLNAVDAPAPHTVLGRYVYEHPLLDLAAIDAQQRLPALQGRRRTWFAGAWTGYGFHEDGLKSALRVARDFGVMPSWAAP